MAFDYYCVGCGQKINQSNVLFDLLPIVDAGMQNFLKFRVTQAELMDLYAHGEDCGMYKKCSLTLPDLMTKVANKNNLGRKEVGLLTMAEIDRFLQYQNDSYDRKQMADDDHTEKYEIPASIQALLDASEKQQSSDLAESGVVDKVLLPLKQCFEGESKLEFEMRLDYENDTKGEPVLVGYALKNSRGVWVPYKTRICPFCQEPIIDHAGTAEHRVVAFVGYRSAAKTSTILALTHYLRAPDRAIWQDAQLPSEISINDSFQNSQKQLELDLCNYPKGIAPNHTENVVREDAYSSSFKIGNKKGESFLLTLLDLPGELFKPNGDIDEDKILNTFSVAISCDLYIACLDMSATQAEEQPSAAGQQDQTKAEQEKEVVRSQPENVCGWTAKLQKLRVSQNTQNRQVPTMLLLTKDKELEKKSDDKSKEKSQESQRSNTADHGNQYMIAARKAYFNQADESYLSQQPIYQMVSKRFNDLDGMKNAYYAIMRASPYGYPAPTEERSGEKQDPVPKNIDKLMKWILFNIGALAPNVEYKYLDLTIRTDDYYLKGMQTRTEAPRDYKEALCRMYLFQNPTDADKKQLQVLGNKNNEALHSVGGWVKRLFRRK